MPQLENIQEVLPSRRDETHFRWSVSRLITPNLWNFQRVLHTLATTQELARHNRLQLRGSTRVTPTSRRAPYPPLSSSGVSLSLLVRERNPGVPIACHDEAFFTGKATGTLGSCHHFKGPPDASVHSRGTYFPCIASSFTTRINTHHGGPWDSSVGKPHWKFSWDILEGKPQIPCSTRRDA